MTIEILSFLDVKSLKECLLLSTQFRDLISDSLKLMSKLKLTVGHFKRGPANRDILKFKRRYTDVNFSGVKSTMWFKYLLDGLQSVGQDVSRITIKNCSFTQNGFSNVMSSFPKVQHLAITKSINLNQQAAIDPAVLSSLTNLSLMSIPSVIRFSVHLH